MPRPIPVSASFIIELNATVEGTYQPYVPATPPSFASGGDPSEGDYCEDVVIAGLTISVKDYTDTGEQLLKWRDVDILEGVDTSHPAVIRLLSNILDCVMAEAQEELRDAAGDEGEYEREDGE